MPTKTKWLHNRRKGALARLEEQLETNQKRTKDGTSVNLTDKDKKRITKEVGILKERV